MSSNDREENAEVTLEDKIDLAEHKANKQMWIVVGFIPLMLLVLVAGIISLASAHKATSSIVAEKPENRVETYSLKIQTVKSKAEEQYQKYLSRMEDESILSVNEKFRIMYDISLQSERDYVELLDLYQKIAYDSASRVKGSGEWYYYYERKITDFNRSAKARESKMRLYFQSDNN